MVPGSLTIWMQRAGRAGRNPLTAAREYLLVQPSMFQEVKSKSGGNGAEDEMNYRKEVEEGLREWIETEDCRREVAAEYFDDGLPRKSE